MKHVSFTFQFLILAILSLNCATAQVSQPSSPQPSPAQHLATALEHVTVLEFSEPVRQAAAGSSAFNIEWRDNSVLIKPVKSGVSTNLFVWTASQRHAYELDPAGDVKNMTYAIDTPGMPKPTPEPREDQMIAMGETLLTRAFLGVDRVNHDEIRNEKGRIVVRVESVFQSNASLYIRYSITNLTKNPYRVLKPSIWEIVPPNTTLALPSLRHTQLDTHTSQRLGETRRSALVVVDAESRKPDLRPGEETQGVIVLRQQVTAATVLQIAFPDAGDRHVIATFVF